MHDAEGWRYEREEAGKSERRKGRAKDKNERAKEREREREREAMRWREKNTLAVWLVLGLI